MPQELTDTAMIRSSPRAWGLSVHVCPKHEVLLETHCRSCGKSQQSVPSGRPVGYCCNCGDFFGYKQALSATVSVRQGLVQELFIRREEFLQQDMHEQLVAGVGIILEKTGLKTVMDLETEISFSDRTVVQWVKGRYKPTITSLLDFCLAVEVTPCQLLLDHHQINPELGLACLTVKKRSEPVVSYEEMEKLLCKLIEKKQFMSLNILASELGVGRSYLEYNFPDLTSRMIVNNQLVKDIADNDKRQCFYEKVKAIMDDLWEEGEYPSYNKVRKKINDYGGFEYSHFTRMWKVLANLY